ncbi:MAG: hypothetical protein OXF76_15195 [Caldilineaceae bacterium]|nr:hypothetical protein [Caldilineaceae bacterium]
MIARTGAVAKLYCEQILNEQRYDSTVEKAYQTGFAAPGSAAAGAGGVRGAVQGRLTGAIGVKIGRGGG